VVKGDDRVRILHMALVALIPQPAQEGEKTSTPEDTVVEVVECES
jgi:hypothetical protein